MYSVPLRVVYQLFTPHCEFTHLSPSDNTHPPDVSFEELGEQLGNFITKCLGLVWPWAAGNCPTAPQEERGSQLLKQQSHFPSGNCRKPWFTLLPWALIPSRTSHRLVKSLLLSSGLLNKDLSKQFFTKPMWLAHYTNKNQYTFFYR